MKHNKYIILSALLALSAVMPVQAQIDAADDSTQINVAFRKVAKEDIMGGVSSLNYRDLMDKNYRHPIYENMDQEMFEWLDAHCAEYGFIKRYPTRKLLLTGWDEPWHYRYVGKEAATFIMEHGICYEEFYAHYNPDFTYG